MTTPSPPPSNSGQTVLDVANGPGERGPGAEGPAVPSTRRRIAPWLAAGAAVGITALIAGGLAVGGRGPLAAGSGGSPDILNIGLPYAGSAASARDADSVRAGRYVLSGTLPTGPDTGTAWRLVDGSIHAGQVAALAAGLGITGEPKHDSGSWVVRDGGAVLRVYDLPGLPFAFDATPDDGSCPSIPIDGYGGPDSPVSCTMTDPPLATTPEPGPDAATLRVLGQSFLAALGAAAQVHVWDGMPYGSLQLDPTVDGAQTSGLGASLQASTDGVAAASGWLAGFVNSGLARGDDYPLRSAKDVFADLATLPEPAMACVQDVSGPTCGGDVTVTGATYGLMLAYDDGAAVLVPAWLFSTEGSDFPMAQVAVQTRYLGEPSNLAGGSGSSGSGGSSTPGSTGTGAAVGPAPVPPGDDPVVDPSTPVTGSPTDPTDPAGPPSPVGQTVTWTGPRTLTLTITGGCDVDTAVASAKLTADTIVVTYAVDAIACTTDLGYLRALPVTLDEDPAGRTVVDGSGTPIPVVGSSVAE